MGRDVIPEGVRYAPVPPELLQLDGVQLAHIRVWCHVWLQTLGRPDWDLSYGQLATGAVLSRRSAIRAVSWLVERGWLIRERRRADEGDDAPNLLRCTFPVRGSDTADTTPSDTADTRGSDPAVTHQKSHYPESHNQESASAPADDARDDRQLLNDTLDRLGVPVSADEVVEQLREVRPDIRHSGAFLASLDNPGGFLSGLITS